jgi:multiple sugar transport system permease protein
VFLAGLCFFLFVALFPIYWLLVLAVTPTGAVYQMGVLPRGVTLANFAAVLDPFARRSFLRYVLNSLVIASATTAVVLAVGSLAGYAFGRFDFPGRRPLLAVVLAISYFPPVTFLVPLFRLFVGSVTVLGFRPPTLYNTAGAIALPLSAFSLPLTIFILTAFYGQIPNRLEDAARIEGSTRLGAFVRVILPLSLPGVGAAGTFTFLFVYNEYLYSSLMNDAQVHHWATIVPALRGLQGAPSVAAAASLVALVPAVVVLLLASEGLARTSEIGASIRG